VEVQHVRSSEQAVDRRVYVAVVEILFHDESPSGPISLNREVSRPDILGKPRILGVPGARRFMNEDRPRKGQRLETGERIEREEDAAVFADGERTQAEPARSVSAGDLHVRGMGGERGEPCGADGVRHLLRQRDDSISAHAAFLERCGRKARGIDRGDLSGFCGQNALRVTFNGA
jgi:hypothetical protein